MNALNDAERGLQNLFLPGVWPLLVTQPCCHLPQPEEPSLETGISFEMPQLPQTPVLDLGPPAWHYATAGMYLLSR